MGKRNKVSEESEVPKGKRKKIISTSPEETAIEMKRDPSPIEQKPARTKKAVEPAPIPFEEIQLRAYFISEERRTHSLPGDEHQDWIEAERQLRAERKAAPPKRKRKK